MEENKMGVMPIDKLIISMSLPIMISMLVQALYNIVDSIFVAMISEKCPDRSVYGFPDPESYDCCRCWNCRRRKCAFSPLPGRKGYRKSK